jgi:hypothetical protein
MSLRATLVVALNYDFQALRQSIRLAETII